MTRRKSAAATKNTGPRTQGGKARSSSNATKHGLTATTTILEHESQDELDALRTGLLAALCPRGHLEVLLAERVVLLAWRLRRFGRVETSTMTTAMQDEPFDFIASMKRLTGDAALGRGIGDSRALEKLQRYETSTERAFYRCLREFWSLQERRADSDPKVH